MTAPQDGVLRDRLVDLERQVRALETTVATLRDEVTHHSGRSQALTAQLAAREAELRAITGSRAWRAILRYRGARRRVELSMRRFTGGEWSDGAPPSSSAVDHVHEPPAPAGSVAQPPADFYASLTLLPELAPDDAARVAASSSRTIARRRPDIVCFSIIDWEFRFQRPQQLMAQFAEHGHRVFYLSTTRFESARGRPRVTVAAIRPNLFEVRLSAVRPPRLYGEIVDGANESAMVAALGELRRVCGIGEAVAYVMIASWRGVAAAARDAWSWRVVYDCMDEWENFPGIEPAIVSAERRLIDEADLVVASGQRLFDKWRERARAVVLAPNASDPEFYARNCRENDALADLRHPIVGYFGAIADWFDLDLVERTARARPGYTFVLIGGVFDVDVSRLKALPNVRLLGQRPYEMMPQYLWHFDACTIPFKVNPITEATDPVKLYEYLAGGKPVVTTALPEVVARQAPVAIAHDADEFLRLVDAAVADRDPAAAESRRQFAAGETWEARYRTIAGAVVATTPRATIVVVTFNNLALTRLCLESILRNTDYPDYEVVVVDNASSDGTPEYLVALAQEEPHVRVLANTTNAGFAAANNQGIAAATGGVLVLLNNDTVVPPGWLSRLVAHLEDPAVGIVGPVTNFVGNEAFVAAPYRTWAEMERFAAERAQAYAGRRADIPMLAMFCVALRRSTYDVVGPLDESFGIGMFEDDDYAYRIRANGQRVVCAPDAFVHHVGQAAFRALIANETYNPLFEANRARFESKWQVTWVPHRRGALNDKPIEPRVPAVTRAVASR